MIKIIVAVISCMFIVFVGFLIIDPQMKNSTGNNAVLNSNSSTFSATIEGEVNKTGTYSLPSGSTIYDLITKAGGLTDNADELAFYEGAEISKGVTYYIAPKYDNTDVCATLPITKVNINEADADSIKEITNISETIATSIVSYRESNGIFYTLESITDVYGIGTATYKKMRNYITLHD